MKKIYKILITLMILNFSTISAEEKQINKISKKNIENIQIMLKTENKSLPKDINKNSKLLEITFDNPYIIYKVIFPFFTKEILNQFKMEEVIDNLVVPNVCFQKNTETLLKKNFQLKYEYFSSENIIFKEILINKEICNSLKKN